MREVKIEQWLDSIPVAYSYEETVKIKDINFDDSTRHANQVRFDLIDLDNAKQMEEDRAAKCEFPALLLNKLEDGTYTILDGNHRVLSAIMCDIETHDSYVVEVEPGSALELRLMLEPNTRLAAKELSEEEKIRWAVYLLHNDKSLTQSTVAAMVKLSKSAVSSAVRTHEAFSRAARLLSRDRQSMNAWEKLNVTIQLTLNRIKSDPGWLAAVDACIQYKLNSSQVNSLLSAIKDCGTDDSAVAGVSAWVQALKESKTAKRSNSVRPSWEYLKMHMGAIKEVDPNKIERELSSGVLDDAQLVALSDYLEASIANLERTRSIIAQQRAQTTGVARRAAQQAAGRRNNKYRRK